MHVGIGGPESPGSVASASLGSDLGKISEEAFDPLIYASREVIDCEADRHDKFAIAGASGNR